MDLTHASHDINGVRVLRIHGWSGGHRVEPRDDSAWVQIEAPKRDGDENWIFQTPKGDGILTCFTSLLGSPRLLGVNKDPQTGEPLVLVVRIPATRRHNLRVEVRPR